jgi:actin-related protein
MDNRNPSRAGKSEREKQHLRQQLKRVSSEDTALTDLPFEASNSVSNDKFPKKSSRRPQPFSRKLRNHFKSNSATYITFFVTVAISLFILPLFGLNREIGELKTDVSNVKESVVELNSVKNQSIGGNNMVNQAIKELEETKQRVMKISDQVSELVNKVTAIRTYLLNRFSAKID